MADKRMGCRVCGSTSGVHDHGNAKQQKAFAYWQDEGISYLMAEALALGDVTDFNDLREKTDSELLQIKGIGPVSLSRIRHEAAKRWRMTRRSVVS
jgi:DNA-directed RNA polymerase alpha subunit